jgi:Na+-transporting NADH:ubiquinone oxidoreductase subunit C
MQRSSNTYTLGFAAAVCAVCSILVSGAAVALKERQQRNVVLDRQLKVLDVCGLWSPDEKLTAAEAQERFDENIQIRFVNLATGEYADDVTEPYDPVKAARTAELGADAPENPAKIPRIPKYAKVHEVLKDGQTDMIILQVWGRGLWSTMYGYVALDKDCETIRGLTFYEQGETPGLGGEVDNPNWKAKWSGRKAFGEDGMPAIAMRKGGAGSVEEDPHGFDAISGATITSRAVENLLNFWLGPEGYAAYLDGFRKRVAANASGAAHDAAA